MSRKGKAPIALPKGVEVKVQEQEIVVKGPKGTLKQALIPGVKLSIEPGVVSVGVENESREMSKFHGLYRALVNNMVVGTTLGFEKRLEMVGVGYRAAMQGNKIDLQVGNSHPTLLDIPAGITVKIDKNTNISIAGIDKQLVGEFAAKIRAHKKPEPYQGKGIRYEGEYVRKKAGKAAKTAKK